MSTTVPELPEQWKNLDLVSILAQPAAFVSISQCNSLYKPEGVQGEEKQWERGTLENTVKVAKACREANMKFFWIGYDVFREDYPKTILDEAQYGLWSKLFNSSAMTKEQKKWDVDLVAELKNIALPEDEEFFEYIKHDLKRIESDLIGFLEVYYPMLRSSWNPQNETDFIIGWLLGRKGQEYSSSYYDKHRVRLVIESLYRIHQEISIHKNEIKKRVTEYLEEKSSD